MSNCIVLVVAAGRGTRLASERPKQYCALGAKTVMWHSLASFVGHPDVNAVRSIIHPDDRGLFDMASDGLDILDPVIGGDSRQESVRRGLESLYEYDPDTVLIHDAARPFVDHSLISRVLDALAGNCGAIPVLAVSDTLKRGRDNRCLSNVERGGLYRAQTPQGFHYRHILEAHRKFMDDKFTDDAAIAEQAGMEVEMVQGSENNFKITTREDMDRARQHLNVGEVRMGTGFDVHRFAPGEQVILCGIAIPFEFSLKGFSDADVGLHALTDALMGAVGAGDIGSHFPPGDDQWKGANSGIFLRKAGELVYQRGGGIVNLDITLICEAPKIAPHRGAMVKHIAEILGISSDRVSVKATTTEGLGFTGRGEGIAAQAVAAVRIPFVANKIKGNRINP